MARLDRYRIGIPRELSEIRTQPWLSEGSLTCDQGWGQVQLTKYSSTPSTPNIYQVQVLVK